MPESKKLKPKPKLNRYLFKAEWQGTALRFWVEAKDEDAATVKASRQVLRGEGGVHCYRLSLVRQLS